MNSGRYPWKDVLGVANPTALYNMPCRWLGEGRIMGRIERIVSIPENNTVNFIIRPEDFKPTLEDKPRLNGLGVKKLIFNNPATIVYWSDGSKTVVKCRDGEPFVEETGFAMAFMKKLMGDSFHQYLREAIDKAEVYGRNQGDYAKYVKEVDEYIEKLANWVHHSIGYPKKTELK